MWSALMFGGSAGLTLKHRVQRLIAIHDAWDPCTGGVFFADVDGSDASGWVAG